MKDSRTQQATDRRSFASTGVSRMGLPIVIVLLALAGCEEAPPPEAAPEAAPVATPETADPAPAATSLTSGGFMTPESVLHDGAADVYLVSNINGEPLGKTGNGFISRLSPDFETVEERWIDGGAEGVTLHAPKGMAIIEDRLYVSDIDVVRVFHRETGEPLEEHPVDGASFLNDLVAGPDGTVYVSDSGLDAEFGPSGTDAIHALTDGMWRVVVASSELANPNGLVVAGDDVLMVPFGGSSIFRIPAAGGEAEEMTALPAGQLDGIVRLADGTLLVSSWEGQAVFRVSPAGEVDVAVDGIEAPADIGWDVGRQRLLIPLFMGGEVRGHTIGSR